MTTIEFSDLSDVELHDMRSSSAKRADSMMAMCTGEGFAAFTVQDEDTQHNYLMIVAELILDVRRANEEINRRSIPRLKRAA